MRAPMKAASITLIAAACFVFGACGDSRRAAAQDLKAPDLFVIGDSITTGFGALGDGPDCAATSETHSAERSYAQLLATRLDLRLVADAVSGRGLVHNFRGANMPTAKATLLDGKQIESLYNDVDPSLVLVHLGTNDFYEHDPQPAFGAAYEQLLGELAATYPDAALMALFGPMPNADAAGRATPAIRAAVDAAAARTGRPIGFVLLDYPKAATGVMGCDWHPGVATHAAMAETLAGIVLRGPAE